MIKKRDGRGGRRRWVRVAIINDYVFSASGSNKDWGDAFLQILRGAGKAWKAGKAGEMHISAPN